MNANEATRSYSGLVGSQTAQPSRERGRGIEDILNDINVELHEGINSSDNLADKLRGDIRPPQPATGDKPCPNPSHVTFRLEQILQAVREINGNLNRAHTAISG